MAWTVNPTATTATITTFLELVAAGPAQRRHARRVAGHHHRPSSPTTATSKPILEQEAATGDGPANAIPHKAQFIGRSAPRKGRRREPPPGLHRPRPASTTPATSMSTASGPHRHRSLDRPRPHDARPGFGRRADRQQRQRAGPLEQLARRACGAESLVGIARQMQKTPPYEGQRLLHDQPARRGMRVVLPGPANTTNTYFIRVRSGAGSVQVTAISQGGPFAVSEVVVGGAVAAAELMKGGPPTITEIAPGSAGGTVSVVELQKGTAVLNEVQEVTVSGGAFTLTFNGQTTATIPAGASSGQVDARTGRPGQHRSGRCLGVRALRGRLPSRFYGHFGVPGCSRDVRNGHREQRSTESHSTGYADRRAVPIDLQWSNHGADQLQRHRC